MGELKKLRIRRTLDRKEPLGIVRQINDRIPRVIRHDGQQFSAEANLIALEGQGAKDETIQQEEIPFRGIKVYHAVRDIPGPQNEVIGPSTTIEEV
jgi:hypothetical protein